MDYFRETGNDGLEKEAEHRGYNNRVFSLYELSLSANNYSAKAPTEYRRLIKEKHSRIYNCPSENIPVADLQEVFGLNADAKEIWRPVPWYSNAECYEASNFGRIRHFKQIMLQDEYEEFSGYLFLKDYVNETDKKYRFNSSTPIYRFVAAAFFPEYESPLHIHHIDNNGYDCRPDNLILLSKTEHSKVHGYFIP